MADRFWPRWLPGRELTAADLLGLEDFLLARSRILDEDAHGIESFDWMNGMAVTDEGDARILRVADLRGVTPAGEPVVCGPNHLRAELDRNGPEHDVWISVGEGSTEDVEVEANDDDGPPPTGTKLSLVVVAARTLPVTPFDHPHRLYLGRYAFPQPQCPEFVHDKTIKEEPFVRRLGALQPRNVDWHSWVNPLHLRITELGHKAFENGLADSALGAELLRLQFEWPALPIPVLMRRLRFVRWLAKSPPNVFPPPDLSEVSTGDVIIEELKALTGRQLPAYLADQLPSPEGLPRAPRETPRANPPHESAPHPPSGLIDALKLLLTALSTGRIDLYAPLEALEVWRTQIAARREIRPIGTALATAIDLDALGLGADLWTRTSILISLAAIEGGTASLVGTGLLSPFRDIIGDTAAQKAGTALEQLYAGEASEKRAGPIAFLALAKAAAETIIDPKGKASAFLTSLREAKPLNAPPRDRVANYLKEAKASEKRQPAAQLRASGRLGRILLLGRPGSGRTSLRQALLAAGTGATLTEVRLLAHGESLDSPSVGRTDVLVAVIEPALLSDPNAAQHVASLKAAIDGALAMAPTLHFALVFSKADEYGVFTPGTSVLHAIGKMVPDPRAKDTKSEAAWKAFREGRRAGEEYLYSNASIGKGGSSGNTEAQPTRTWLVDRTRPLWELASDRSAAFVNARLATCRPFDRRFDPGGEWSARQLLIDLNHLI